MQEDILFQMMPNYGMDSLTKRFNISNTGCRLWYKKISPTLLTFRNWKQEHIQARLIVMFHYENGNVFSAQVPYRTTDTDRFQVECQRNIWIKKIESACVHSSFKNVKFSKCLVYNFDMAQHI